MMELEGIGLIVLFAFAGYGIVSRIWDLRSLLS